jgi:hypothetical protein
MSPRYRDFAEWLFPGDPVAPVSNPLPEDPDVEDILEEVSSCTGVPLDWLKRAAQGVLRGLSGLGCLWYLHGAAGRLEKPPDLDNLDLPKELSRDLRDELLDIWKAHLIKNHAGWVKKYKTEDLRLNIDWYAGRLAVLARPPGKIQYDVVASVKLGKILRKNKASAALMKAFETRELPSWEWRVSCHPYDVLTMSFRRPWTSCMRPPDPEGQGSSRAPGEYQYGPLTDMAAGAAVLFFYRPGADVPSGRVILRPALLPQMDEYGNSITAPGVVYGKVVYGSGPGDLKAARVDKMLRDATGVDLIVEDEPICPLGQDELALTRNIYSDTDREECVQSPEEYAAAYENLGEADWPESRLDLGDLAEVSGKLEHLTEELLENQIEEAVEAIAQFHAHPHMTLQDMSFLHAAVDSKHVPTADDFEGLESHIGMEVDEDEVSSIENSIRDRILELLSERLQERLDTIETRVLLIAEEDTSELDYGEYSLADYLREMFVGNIYQGHLPIGGEILESFNYDHPAITRANLDDERGVDLIIAAPVDYDITELRKAAKTAGLLIKSFTMPGKDYEWDANDWKFPEE